MKYKSHMRTPVAILLLIASIATTVAQPAVGNPPAIDPTTGLPVPQPAPQWKDPNWPDPAKVLPQVNFDGLPVSEVARYLSEQFSTNFDIVIAGAYNPNNATAASNPGQGSSLIEAFEPYQQIVKLQLRNVTASEVFNAMNLEFEAQNDPVQWKLVMNGNRPTALLRVVPELLPHPPAPPPAPEIKRMVFFVGDLVGDEKAGGMTMDQVVQTVEKIYSDALHSKPDIHVSKDAQLLIISGTPDQVDFVKQILQGLKQKVDSANVPADLKEQTQKLKALNRLNSGTSANPK